VTECVIEEVVFSEKRTDIAVGTELFCQKYGFL